MDCDPILSKYYNKLLTTQVQIAFFLYENFGLKMSLYSLLFYSYVDMLSGLHGAFRGSMCVVTYRGYPLVVTQHD